VTGGLAATTGCPFAICSVIDLAASGHTLHTQLRPSWIVHSPNLPDGSLLPTVQKMTSPCGFKAR
jgi:hypothetical protein